LAAFSSGRAGELHGHGDLRFYAAVQVYAILILLLLLLVPAKYTRSSDFAVVVGFYVLAKILEESDRQIFALGHIVSGPYSETSRRRRGRLLDSKNVAEKRSCSGLIRGSPRIAGQRSSHEPGKGTALVVSLNSARSLIEKSDEPWKGTASAVSLIRK
jgi:hypothetical protein